MILGRLVVLLAWYWQFVTVHLSIAGKQKEVPVMSDPRSVYIN